MGEIDNYKGVFAKSVLFVVQSVICHSITGTGMHSHPIAPPPPPLPEFMDEAHYLSDFIVRWKLKEQGIEDKDIGVMDTVFLSQWRKHRAIITARSMAQRKGHDIIPSLIYFVDALVLDWFTVLTTDSRPFEPLDKFRLLAFENLWRKLNAIPGDSWEIKY
jgi:hypothetical protein